MNPERTSLRQGHGGWKARLAALACLLALLASLVPAGRVPRDPGTPARAPSPPILLVLQPDAANGTDTSVLEATPAWDYGDNPSMWAGKDPANGTMSRGLLRFNISGIPADATILNATLDLYQHAGDNGTVTVRLASAPWTEGPGERSWLRIPVTVRETAGVRRTNEPVGLTLAFPPGSVVDPASELRMFLNSAEVPSQLQGCAVTVGRYSSCTVYFGASAAPWSAVAFDASTGANATVTPAYRLGAMGAGSLWTAPLTSGGASGVSVADLDGDGRLDIVFGTASGSVRAVAGNGSDMWEVQVASGRAVPYVSAISDMDGDGREDIIAVSTDTNFAVVRLNSTGGVVWTAPGMVQATLPIAVPTLFDVDGDGVLDVLIGSRDGTVIAYNGTTGAAGTTYTTNAWAFTPSIFDMNGDGRAEVYVGSDNYTVHGFDAGGRQLWANSPTMREFIENSLSIGDVDNDGRTEVVTGDFGSPGNAFALEATDGRVDWWTPLPGSQSGGQALADIDRDGFLEAILGTSAGAMYALHGSSGAIDWMYPGGTAQASAPAVADINNDGNLEVIYVEDGGTAVRVLDRTGAQVHSWAITANVPGLRQGQRTMATPAVADINNDGMLEVIVPTGAGVRAFATGGLAHDWRIFGYNLNQTHRVGDGNSPEGAPFLQATVGATDFRPARGASWDYRDGVTAWMSQGGDFGVNEASLRAGPGWNAWNITSAVAGWYNDLIPNLGVFVWAGPGASSGWHAFYSSDASNASLRPKLTVTYTVPVYDPVPRIVGRIPDLAAAEDSPPFSRDLSMYAADDDSPPAELRWNVTGVDPAVLLVTGLNVPGNHLISFYPQRDGWGNRAVTYWLTDLQGHTTRQSAWINITPVNDGPVFGPPATFVVRANSTYTFNFGPYILDVDTPRSGLTLSSDDPVHTSVSGFNVSFLYPMSFLGQWVFVGLTVSDGELSDGKVVALKVSMDDPPVLVRLLPDVTVMEGQTLSGVFDLDDYFADPNHDAMFYSFGYTHLNITIHADNTVDIQADSEWTGIEFVTFRGVDTQNAMAEDTILVTVIPVDDPPVLGPVPDLRVHHGANYSFNLDPYISDPDTPLDRINASTSSPFVNVSGHLLVLLYPQSLNGTTQPLTIYISDGFTTVWRTIRVTVGDDWPPALRSKLPDRMFLEDTVLRGAYNLSAAFTDADNSTLFWSSGNRSVLVSIDAEGVVDLRAVRDWSGIEQVTFRATDALGALAEDTVWVTVLPVDDAPYFAPVPTIYMNTTTAYFDLAPYMFDVDTNASELQLTTSDPHALVVGAGILLNFTSDTTTGVEVEISDGVLSNTTTITVVVRLPAPPPAPPAELPAYLYWIPLPILAAALAVFLVYRRRTVEWALLATNSGLLVSSVFREDPAALDTDLITGMLTAIMNFAKASFSGDKDRELDDLTLGDRRVAVVRGDLGFLAVVFKGRTSGRLPKTMRAILAHIEARYPAALDQVVDSADLEDIPVILKRFVDRSWWPFPRFGD